MSTKLTLLQEKYEIIANIKADDKLCVNTWRSVSKSFYGTLIRYWTGENRELTIEHLKTLIEKTKKYIRKMSINELFPFETLIKNAIMGIENLIKTYRKDTKMVVELNSIYMELKKIIKLIKLRVELLSVHNVYSDINESDVYYSTDLNFPVKESFASGMNGMNVAKQNFQNR